MPVKVYRRKGEYRVCEVEGNKHIAKSKNGRPMDGGGHGQDRVKAERQAAHINASKRRES